MKNSKYTFRVFLTFLCIIVAFCSFFLPPPPETVTTKISAEKTISTTHNKGAKFFEWVGILFLALSVWIWRRELKLTGFGPLSGVPLEQQSPEEFRKGDVDTFDSRQSVIDFDISSIPSQMRKEELEYRIQRILDLFRERHALNASIVARDLGVSAKTAKIYLFMLTKEGKVRCDGFPKKALYTLATSIENLAIDRVRQIIENDSRIDSERRYVKIKRAYEVDAIFESGRTKFLVEIRLLKKMLEPSNLDDWINRLLQAAGEIKADKIVCYIVLVISDLSILSSAQTQIKRFTYDSGSIETRIIVFSENELIEGTQNKRLHKDRS